MKRERKRQPIWVETEHLPWDLWLVVPVVGLVLFGLIMVYSASLGTANPERTLLVQASAGAAGLLLMSFLRKFDYQRLASPAVVYGFLGICVTLLSVVLLAPKVKGASRWIPVGKFTFQPSELAKLGLILFLAWFLMVREEEGLLSDFWSTLAPVGVILGILSALLLREPDLGTTLVLCLICFVMLYVGGVPAKYLLYPVPLGVAGVVALIMFSDYRRARLEAFLDPERFASTDGYQSLQSLIAIGSGGVHGLGLGLGRQKMAFLPEVQSDFIFPVIAEELGLVGAATFVLVFGFLLWRGIRVCLRAPDTHGRLIATGIVAWIGGQALFNLSVTLNLLPAKGITLPFISTGGTSLLSVLVATGILLNISAQGAGRAAGE
ncbi:MAG: FtsW/RodA/SpoVE family cell cycle protein [Blastocatellia bacterium]